MSLVIKSKRLYLRPLSRNDLDDFFALSSDPEVMTYLDDQFSSITEAQELLERVVEKNEYYGNKLGLFAAHLASDDEFIGWFILRPSNEAPDDKKNLEIGYRLKVLAWGKGYATEGAEALKTFAVEEFGARRLFASAIKAHSASINVMKKIGMRFENEYQEPKYKKGDCTAVLYSMKI